MIKDKDIFVVPLQIDADDLCVRVKNLWVVNVVIILMDIRVNDVIHDQQDGSVLFIVTCDVDVCLHDAVIVLMLKEEQTAYMSSDNIIFTHRLKHRTGSS